MWLLRRRFLILSHVGRVSGRVHRTCLMVLHEDRDRGEIVVAAGSRTADWYRNILAAPLSRWQSAETAWEPRSGYWTATS